MDSNETTFFNQLYIENFQKIRSWAYRHLGNHNLAEDIAQETFLVAVIKIDEVMEHPNPRAWLYTAARNLIMHALRDMKNEITHMSDIDSAMCKDQSEIDVGLFEVFPRNFTEEDKRVLIMYYVEQCTVKEVADAIGISVSACKMRLLRLRNELRKIL